jgi:hypothetical protein
MTPALRRSRWALWAFAMALLLKAGVPLLASAAAGVQGKSLVEVCTVYGVATVVVDDTTPDRRVPHALSTDAACALAVTGGAAPPPCCAALITTATPRSAACIERDHDGYAPDANALWRSRLQHGPPQA